MSTNHRAPNILVVNNCEKYFILFKDFLKNLIGINTYTIYNVQSSQFHKVPSIWMDNCQLLVYFEDECCDNEKIVDDFFLSGGRIITFPSILGFKIDLDVNKSLISIGNLMHEYEKKDCRKEFYDSKLNQLKDLICFYSLNNDQINGLHCVSRVMPIASESQIILNEIYLDIFTRKLGLKMSLDSQKLTHIQPYHIYSKNKLLNSIHVIESYVKDHLSHGVSITTRTNDSFNEKEYYSNLETNELGKIVLYSEMVTSTMNAITNVPNSIDLVAIATQQVDGQGSGKNEWLSPQGCSMFTIYFNLQSQTFSSSRLCLLQYIAAISCVEAIVLTKGYEQVPLKIKWPNDIYYGTSSKLGGVLVKSSIMGDTYQVRIGVGVNTSNAYPTLCLNSVFKDMSLDEWSCEKFIAKTLTRIEYHLNELKTSQYVDGILELYTKYWIHTNQKIQVDKWNEQVKVIGIDEYGYLQVKRLCNDEIHLLQPDGNRFDMTRNLIVLK